MSILEKIVKLVSDGLSFSYEKLVYKKPVYKLHTQPLVSSVLSYLLVVVM